MTIGFPHFKSKFYYFFVPIEMKIDIWIVSRSQQKDFLETIQTPFSNKKCNSQKVDTGEDCGDVQLSAHFFDQPPLDAGVQFLYLTTSQRSQGFFHAHIYIFLTQIWSITMLQCLQLPSVASEWLFYGSISQLVRLSPYSAERRNLSFPFLFSFSYCRWTLMTFSGSKYYIL